MFFWRFWDGVFVIQSKYSSVNLKGCSASTKVPFSVFIKALEVCLRGHEAVADAER